MKNKEQEEGGERTERSTEPSLPSRYHHRRVRSVPPSIHSSHSVPPHFGKLLLVKIEHLIFRLCSLTSLSLSTLQCATNGAARKQGNHTHASAAWPTILIANDAFQIQLSMILTNVLSAR